MCVTTVKALLNVGAEIMRYHRCSKRLCFLLKARNYIVTHKCVVLVIVGERHESLQIMLPRNEVADI